MKDILKQSFEPVDPELFLYCQNVFHAAASLSMPVENPASKAIFSNKGSTYALSDIPMNRGMLAVMKELREAGYSDDVKMAVSMRLMHFGEVLRSKKTKAFVKREKPGELMVSEALIKACAVAKMRILKGKSRFDINDVVLHAARFTEEDEKQKKGK